MGLPSRAVAFRLWLRIGLLSFGGPAGQIAMMHHEIVDRRRWVGETRFLRALSFCALLPGPEAQQLATYLGWLMHGPSGGLVAGTLFVLPGAAVMLVLSALYAELGMLPAIDGLFFGLKCAVLALIAQAVLRMARRALKTRAAWFLAMGAFVALALFHLPFPAVIVMAALLGSLAPRSFASRGLAIGGHQVVEAAQTDLIGAALAADTGRAGRLESAARRAGLATLILWLVPVGVLVMALPGTYARIAVFFSKMAVVTVGGAYAVLAYVAQDAVQGYGWLSPADMLTGLGLAETTPGPLILVLQFVGFMAGFHAPGGLTGLAGGLVASTLTLWVTFLPCFTFVFFGAPLLERLAGNQSVAGALAGTTACVVGVIANLGVWFGLHSLFRAQQAVMVAGVGLDAPVLASLDRPACALSVFAATLLFGFGVPVPAMLGATALLGMAARLLS